MTNEKARQEYNSQGFVFMPGAVSSEQVDRLNYAVDRAAAKDKNYNANEPKFTINNVLGENEIFIDMVDHPKIFPTVRAVMGDDVQLRYASAGLVKPGFESGGGWHCDLSDITGVYLPDSLIMIKVFTYLVDVPDDGATLAIVPGSHRFEMGHPMPDIKKHEDMPHHVTFPAKAGDAVLFNGYCWHARFHNRSGVERKVLEYSYCHSWMNTMYDYRELPDHIQQAMLKTHDRRQLFGVPEPEVNDWHRRLEGEIQHLAAQVGE